MPMILPGMRGPAVRRRTGSAESSRPAVYHQGRGRLLTHMRMITPGMARSLTPTTFVERPAKEARPPREHRYLAAARTVLSQLAQTVRHPRLRHIGH